MIVVLLWKIVFFAVKAADVIFTTQFIVTGPFPKAVVVAPVTVSVPFWTVPAVNWTVVPFTVSVPPFMSSVPLVTVRLLILVLAPSLQVLPPVTTVTLSAAPGIPLGAQLVAVFHDVEVVPVQV